MRNRGELLIESLISLVIISISLIPISKSIYTSYFNLKIINKKIDSKINELNIIEYLKGLEYEEILKLEGNNIYENINSFINQFNLKKEYFFDTKYKINIKLEKLNIYIEDKDNRMYLFKIKVGDYEDLWIPK